MSIFNKKPDAAAYIIGGISAPSLFGRVSFYQKKDSVLIVAKIFNLPESASGFYGFHIHQGKACTGNSFSNTAGHYNPYEKMHPRHAGDLPPLLAFKSRAYLAVQTDRFRVKDVIGRAVVIHSGADDFTTQPAGNAGEKIACGIIIKYNVIH